MWIIIPIVLAINSIWLLMTDKQIDELKKEWQDKKEELN